MKPANWLARCTWWHMSFAPIAATNKVETHCMLD
jgi:hypothetical protein